jgi:hypothetical protein
LLERIKAAQAAWRWPGGEVDVIPPPYVMTCADYYGEGIYTGFEHEADIMLTTLSRAVQDGTLSPEHAREAYRQYRAFYPFIYEPGYIEDDEWGFPVVSDDLEPFESSPIGWEADSLGIEGIGILREGLSPMSGEILQVHGLRKLEALRQHFDGRYHIVLVDPPEPWIDYPPDEAQVMIERVREMGATSVGRDGPAA